MGRALTREEKDMPAASSAPVADTVGRCHTERGDSFYSRRGHFCAVIQTCVKCIYEIVAQKEN